MRSKNSTPTTNSHKSALIYCRVSTKGQVEKAVKTIDGYIREEGTSLDSQAHACLNHAESLGYNIGRVTKEVYSGAELWDRPLLARDRLDLKSGEFQALICFSTDRLSRDPIHLAIIADECERAGVELLFVTEPLDTSPEAALIRYVKGYAHQMEREKIKERMLRGRKAKLLSGKPTFHGWELYGYRSDKRAGKYEMVESEALIVRQIFELYVSGMGTHAIASKFNREAIPSPKVSMRGQNSKWSGAVVYKILTNPSYKGEEFQWKTKCNSKGTDHPRPKSEWVRLPDGIRPPIVSAEVWQQAQDTLELNRGDYTRNTIRPVLLRGLIFCAECGQRMIYHHYKKEKYDYHKYRCSSRWRPFKTLCKGKGVPYSECNEWVWEKIKDVLLDPGIVQRELARLEKIGPDSQLTTDLETARRQLYKVERGLQGLLRRFRDSVDDENLWPFIEREIGQATKEKQQIESTIAQIEARLATQSQTLTNLRSLNEYCAHVASNLDKFGFEEKRLALEALGVQVRANGSDWRLEIRVPSGEVSESRYVAPLRSVKND